MMKTIIKNEKCFRPVLVGLVFAILVEIFIFNINAVRSWSYTEIPVTNLFSVTNFKNYYPETENYEAGEEGIVLTYNGELAKVDSVYLGIDFLDPLVNAEIVLSDEGNSKEYSLSSREIVGGLNGTRYITIHPYGKVKTMNVNLDIDEGCLFRINSIVFNAKRPIDIRWKRVGVVFLVLMFLFYLRKKGHIHSILFNPSSKMQILGTGIVCAFTLLLVYQLWTLSYQTWNTVEMRQYQDLTVAITEGRSYLPYEVDPKLALMENPYDYQARKEVDDLSYQWDTAYFEGRYYCYFGITPVLILYLPMYLLTGILIHNTTAMLFFSVFLVIGNFYLIRQLMCCYFPYAPYYIWPFLSVTISMSGTYAYLYMRPDFYNIPVIASCMFVTWGMALWIKARRLIQDGLAHKDTEGCVFNGTMVYMVGLGALCMALVSGCRPQMLIFSLSAVPIFGEYALEMIRTTSGRRVLGAFIIPFCAIAVVMMYYNFSRFGSVLDFGANYNLTTNDMTKRGMNLDRVGNGWMYFLILPPAYIGTFPFFQPSVLSSWYMGKLLAGKMLGGIIPTNLISFSLFASWEMRQELKERKLITMMIGSLGILLTLSFLDASIAGVLQRYLADFCIALFVPSCVIIGIIAEKLAENRSSKAYGLFKNYLVIVLLSTVFYAVLLPFVQTEDYLFRSDPLLYAQIRSYFIL